jgi:uncharacterized protein (TIGR02145 family)
MKTKFFPFVILISCSIHLFGQEQDVNLKFTAVDGTSYVQLDSIKIQNRTYGNEYMFYWPDTAIVLNNIPGSLFLFIGYMNPFLNIGEYGQDKTKLYLYQNYPNPFSDRTEVTIFIDSKRTLNLAVTDILGRMVTTSDFQLQRGYHTFQMQPDKDGIYFLTARHDRAVSSVKMLATGCLSGGRFLLEYSGSKEYNLPLNRSLKDAPVVIESGFIDSPGTDRTYTFQFATNIPCPETPTVEYDGQVYNTIQVFSQCWIKENLNAGTMIPNYQSMKNNGIIEKYCYENLPENCDTYGGLYYWDEAMQYSIEEAVQGICPPGWHIPTDEEFKVLEGAVDYRFPIGDEIWDSWSGRGYDSGERLKSASGWIEEGNGTDLFGFSCLPSGYGTYNSYGLLGERGSFWLSTLDPEYQSSAQRRIMEYDRYVVSRAHTNRDAGFSIRCIKNIE